LCFLLIKISKKQGKNDRVPTFFLKKNIEKVCDIKKSWDSVIFDFIFLNLAMLQRFSMSQTFSMFLDGHT
jgi:hypothetical protein